MAQTAKKILEEFDTLPEDERAEVVVGVLRRVALSPHSLPDEHDLTAVADSVFLELDRRESGQ